MSSLSPARLDTERKVNFLLLPVFMELAGTLVLPAAIAFTLYLIVVAIIPGTVKPVLSLILLAIILGIPAVLIVVTSRKVAYLGWMLIYLMSLPIWNFGELLVFALNESELCADLSSPVLSPSILRLPPHGRLLLVKLAARSRLASAC